jgi:hypothetical protein
MVESILKNRTKAQIMRYPFPHIIVNNALAPDYYAELEANYPSLQTVAGEGDLKNNHAYFRSAELTVDNPDIAPMWREFFAYHTSAEWFAEVLSFWGEEIARIHPGLTENFGKPIDEFTVGMRREGKLRNSHNAATDVVLDCLFGNNSPVTADSSVRGPHVDSSRKLFSGLLYMRAADDDSKGGAFEFYKLHKRKYPKYRRKAIPNRYVDKVKELPYQANTLVMWLNSGLSLHGVSQRSKTQHPRRYISFTGESYRGEDTYFYSIIRNGAIEEAYAEQPA